MVFINELQGRQQPGSGSEVWGPSDTSMTVCDAYGTLEHSCCNIDAFSRAITSWLLMHGGGLTCDTRSVTCVAVAPGAARAVLTRPLACSSSSLTVAVASASLRALT